MEEVKRKILIVEDDLGLGEMIRTRLDSAGFEVQLVPDAVLAVQEAHQFKPDLMVLDLLLPAGGGLQVLTQLKASIHTAHIPVLILTGMKLDAHEGALHQILKIGVQGFLQKPFDGQKFLAEVKRILHLHGSRRV